MKPITLQDIWNAGWQKFVIEQAPLAYDHSEGKCFYRTKDDHKCVVGLVLPETDPNYREIIKDNCAFYTVVSRYSYLFDDSVFQLMEDECNNFQKCLHDSLTDKSQNERKTKYLEVAKRYNLTLPEGVSYES